MTLSDNIYSILSLDTGTSEILSTEYIEKSWQRDNILLRAVQTGNKNLLKEATALITREEDRLYYYGNPVISSDMLRTRKNGMIIRNTICRVAAGLGGVPPLYLHLISEKYGMLIAQASSIDYLINELSKEMFEEYCDLVANFSASHYSPLIKEIVVHISNHLQQDLSVSELADAFHVNASHLSRKFKKETGYTISEYINRQKVDAAKLLFSRGHSSVTNVASMMGFNSSSYFSKIFKKVTGESPVDYLKRVKNS